MFAFGQRAAHIAAQNATMLSTLIAAGADVNLKSDWENGPYTVLDNADEGTARFLLAHGATLTPNVAARLGWLDELRALVDANGASVHARGGDGQQPLHEARTVAIADFLLDRGAGVDVRCVDHKSTPAQYALVDRPDVCRRLLERGAAPDIFMAARLGDIELATRLLDADPACIAARINQPGYPPVPPFAIYCWSLGVGMSPHEVALKFDHRGVHDLLVARSPGRIRLMNALSSADEHAAQAVLAEDPSLLSSLTRQEHGHLAQAIFHERFAAADLMLRLGFDPAAPGVDGGTALHAACWVGNVRMVERAPRAGRRAARRQGSDPSEHAPRMGRVWIRASPRARRGVPRPSSTDSSQPALTSPRSGTAKAAHCWRWRTGQSGDAGRAAPSRRRVTIRHSPALLARRCAAASSVQQCASEELPVHKRRVHLAARSW